MKLKRTTKRYKAKPAAKAQAKPARSDTLPEMDFREARTNNLKINEQLALLVSKRVKALKMTQSRAADLLGLKQVALSKLKHGMHFGFSLERLMAILNALGTDIEVVLKPHKEGGKPHLGSVRVVKG